MGIFDELTSGVVVSPLIDKFLESRGFSKSKNGHGLILVIDSGYQDSIVVQIGANKVRLSSRDGLNNEFNSLENAITLDAKNSPKVFSALLNKMFSKMKISSHGENTGSFDIITSPHILSPTLDGFLISRGFKYTKKQGELGRELVLYIRNDATDYTKLTVRYRSIIGENIIEVPYNVYGKANMVIKKSDLDNVSELVKSLDTVLSKLR